MPSIIKVTVSGKDVVPWLKNQIQKIMEAAADKMKNMYFEYYLSSICHKIIQGHVMSLKPIRILEANVRGMIVKPVQESPLYKAPSRAFQRDIQINQSYLILSPKIQFLNQNTKSKTYMSCLHTKVISMLNSVWLTD